MTTTRFFAFALSACLLPLAGCMGAEDAPTGTFALFVKDQENRIGDFSHLNVTVTKVTLTKKDGETVDLTPSDGTFDLTKLTGSNATQIFGEELAVGNYTRLDLFIENATGVLAAGGTTQVMAPSGRLFSNVPFEVVADEETVFLFDIEVHLAGDDQGRGNAPERYLFKPNASATGPKHERPENVIDA